MLRCVAARAAPLPCLLHGARMSDGHELTLLFCVAAILCSV